MAKTPQQLASEAGIKDFSQVQSFIDQGVSPEASVGNALGLQNKQTAPQAPPTPPGSTVDAPAVISSRQARKANARNQEDLQTSQDALEQEALRTGQQDTTTQRKSIQDQAQPEVDDIDNEIKRFTDLISARSESLDAATRSSIANIESVFNRRRDQQRDINKRSLGGLTVAGVRAGRQRFAPEIQTGILSREEREGMDRISALDSQERQFIAEATQANDENQFALLNEKLNAVRNARIEKSEVIRNLEKIAIEQEKAQFEKNKFELDVLKVQESFMTNDIKEFNFAQDQGFEGDFLDFLSEQGAQQKPPTSFQEFTLAGGEQGTGKTFAEFIAKAPASDALDELLSPNQLVLFNAPAGSTLRDVMGQVPKTQLTGTQKFTEENNLSKEFEKLVGDGRSAVRQIGIIRTSLEQAKKANAEGGSINAASQGVLVAFQKLLDPTSVVRETEYARSGDGAALWERMKGTWAKIKQGGAGLTAEGLEEFVDTAESFLVGYKDEALKHAERMQIISEQRGLNLPSILTQDMIDLLEGGEAQPVTLENYFRDNPDQQESIEQMIIDNPDLSDEDILQIVNPDFSQAAPAGNVGANLPQRNLNPGNVKAGGIADRFASQDASGSPVTDEQGHLVFNTPEDGFKALRADLKAKTTGNSRFVKSKNPSIREIGKAFAEDPNWPISVARILGVGPDTKASELNFEDLVQAVAQQEGFFA